MGAANATMTSDHDAIVIKPNDSHNSLFTGMQDSSLTIRVETIHLSCASDVYRGDSHNYAGFILYKYNDMTEWRLNGRTCKSGYLVVQDTDSSAVRCQVARSGIVHGKVYKNVFGEDVLDADVVGEGFSVMGGVIRWESGTFNLGTIYHDEDREMCVLLQRYVRHVLEEWMEAGRNGYGLGCRNYPVKDID